MDHISFLTLDIRVNHAEKTITTVLTFSRGTAYHLILNIK